MNHQAIIIGFLKNDKQVILYLYRKLFHQVKKMVLESGGDEDDIRNTIWKAFNAFKVKCQKDAHKIKNVEAYVFQIARFLWYQELRHHEFGKGFCLCRLSKHGHELVECT